MESEEDLPELKSGELSHDRLGQIYESVRGKIPEAKLCSLFCGGRNCKYEDASHWPDELQAVRGIYSTWITENILAMSRPNTEMIKAKKIIQQFKRYKIKAIINLQTPGEHCHCGPPLEPSGFSYDPQVFMKEGISFYNYAWRDFGFGSSSNILDIVGVMQFTISEGKVAVHCHAGLGRTGLLIACYLMYSNRLTATTSIQYVRSKRPGTIQTPSQVKCVQDFGSFLSPMRVIFSSVLDEKIAFTLSQFLSRQNFMLHGWEARRLKYLPKVIFVCSERLLELAGRQCTNCEHQNLWMAIQSQLTSSKILLTMSKESLSSLHRRSVDTIVENINVSSIHHCISLEGFNPIRPVQKSHTAGQVFTLCCTSGDEESKSEVPSIPARSWRKSLRLSIAKIDKDRRKSVVAIKETVVVKMSATEYDTDKKTKIYKYKDRLNNCCGTWRSLRKEDDALVLSGIIWAWFEELQEPVLNAHDLQVMLRYVNDPIRGLTELERGDSITFAYLTYIVACLRPLPLHLETSLIQRILSTLTHQTVVDMDDESEVAENYIPVRTANDFARMRTSMAEKLTTFFVSLVELNRTNICECRHN